MGKIYLVNAILLCALFFIKEFCVMYHIVISRWPIQLFNCNFKVYHVLTPALIPAFYEHGFVYQKKITGPDI